MPAPVPAPSGSNIPPPAPQQSPEEIQQLPTGEIVHEIGFWQEPWVQNVLPLVTSIAIHLGFILAGYAMFKGVEKFTQVVREQIVIPDSTIVENGEAGGIPNPGLGGDPTRAAAQNEIENVDAKSEGWANKQSDSLAASMMGSGQNETPSETMIGFGSNSGFGKGTATGGGTGDGSGPIARFGVPGGGGGIGPKSNFMGTGGNAMSIIYICDASGSMMSMFGTVKYEAKFSIDKLKPIQSFNVIFFNEKTSTLTQGPLMLASADNKRKAMKFVDDAELGPGTEPALPMKIALDQKPDLIYLLTDGFDVGGSRIDTAEFERTIAEKNRDHKTRINCIYIYDRKPGTTEKPQDLDFRKFLTKIAQENGGTIKSVNRNDY